MYSPFVKLLTIYTLSFSCWLFIQHSTILKFFGYVSRQRLGISFYVINQYFRQDWNALFVLFLNSRCHIVNTVKTEPLPEYGNLVLLEPHVFLIEPQWYTFIVVCQYTEVTFICSFVKPFTGQSIELVSVVVVKYEIIMSYIII